MNLTLFRQAQDEREGGYQTALAELQRGRKSSHWIWYIFPQLAGLGSSPMARKYALLGQEDAIAYLRDPVLGPRLERASEEVARHLEMGTPLVTIMGSQIDALKIISSMTLFGHVAMQLSLTEPDRFGSMAARAKRILDIAVVQGFAPCAHTRAALQR